MKTAKIILYVIVLLAFAGLNNAMGQWANNGANIYNTNSGNVGIGNNSPSTLLFVAKNMTEPTITVRNLGGFGGATYAMVDDASGANWKFKATTSGGFKIRDNANALDVFIIEPNSAANALYINSTGSIGLGTNTPDASAALVISSTTKGFLPPRMTDSEILLIPNPANGLVVYNTTDEHFYVYTSTAGAWKRVAYDANLCGSPYVVTHTAGAVAPVTKTVTYGTVMTNLTGSDKCWITQNLGADHQAAAAADATEPSAGWYWQFNRMQGYKHDGTTRTPNTTWITSIDENSDWLTANDPCALLLGAGWRLPTSTEWTNVNASGGWVNWYGPWTSALKMHAAGYLSYSIGSLLLRGSNGSYWSSTQFDNSNGWYLGFYSVSCGMYYAIKTYGFSARCLRD